MAEMARRRQQRCGVMMVQLLLVTVVLTNMTPASWPGAVVGVLGNTGSLGTTHQRVQFERPMFDDVLGRTSVKACKDKGKSKAKYLRHLQQCVHAGTRFAEQITTLGSHLLDRAGTSTESTGDRFTQVLPPIAQTKSTGAQADIPKQQLLEAKEKEPEEEAGRTQRREQQLEQEELVPTAAPQFASGMWVSGDGACVFTNAVVDQYRTVLVVPEEMLDDARQLAVACFTVRSAKMQQPYDPSAWTAQRLVPSSKVQLFCSCFHAFRVPVFTTPAELWSPKCDGKDFGVLAPTLGVERWSQPPHIFHESIQLSALPTLLHQHKATLPPFGHVSFFKAASLNAWQEKYYAMWFKDTHNARFQTGLDFRQTALFPGDEGSRHDRINNVDIDDNRPRFFHSLVAYHPEYDLFGHNKVHAGMFHRRAVDFMFANTDKWADGACPPRRVVILQRSTGHKLRRFSNMDAVQATAKAITGIAATVATTNESTSLYDQAAVFRDAGLVISSHSSQVFGMAWMHPNSAVVEAVPVIFNSHFAQAAANFNIHYRFAFGASNLSGCIRQRANTAQHNQLRKASMAAMECGATLECAEKERQRLKQECDTSTCRREVKVAGRDWVVCNSFDVDIPSLRNALKAVVAELDGACRVAGAGRWRKA
ncbi:hypothetical protein PTSG_05892 [Salpingoeca rosetta]|uniref:Glycosyltransferase 61 catalytic domain-containing protein n=1 Tax=Salpingoeca rosetta (strain ATCC 50818 / BSB-021) TaxID=946362 RepID=F2UD33_SALR5|nr:uncharacterized protein PTSG_05892 [Salpingoeca rosetta]EGD74528.1 hypothetical protein PTSG_05892 [Salpingoeca rosetta]|eukprot:XP_004992785.1 hypothetical protein PTSG_05892 [Salpingoeca rosetta]